jgi:hypothetical protein
MPKKTIATLEEDIKEMLADVISGKSKQVDEAKLLALGERIAYKVGKALTSKEVRVRPPKTLYMSEIGQPCKRKLWYDYNTPNLAGKEKLLPQNLIKFMYGDILEEVLLFLAEHAGHEVRDQQKRVELDVPSGWKVVGKIDAIIDDTVVDCKTASTYSFKKFEDGLKPEDDSFGYISQLVGYVGAIRVDVDASDERVRRTGANNPAFLVIDKTTGDITTDVHGAETAAFDTRRTLAEAADAVSHAWPAAIPRLPTVVHTAGQKLGVNCSYCPYKQECWKDSNGGKGLRTFIYSTGPLFLTEVTNTPRVTEITHLIKERMDNTDD